MLDKIKEENILFIDIETVGQQPSYDQLDEHTKELWAKKMAWQSEKECKSPEELYERAGIWAEFGKIVCISAGFIVTEDGERHFRVKSFCGSNERMILTAFSALLNKHFNKDKHMLCAHNGKEFDFPYIARRMMINGIQIPKILQVAGKKPWETNFIDTMELWKFGDYKSYTSLDLLCAILDIPTPKDDINGSEVGRVYWQENDLERIKTYCQKDVLAIAQLMRRFNYLPLIADDCVDYTN